VLRSRKLVGGVVAFATAAVCAIAALPTASADECVITVTLVGGLKESFTVNVPPGTPLSQISLPITLPIASISETCAPTAAAPTTGSTTTGATTSPPTTTHTGTGSTSTASSPAPKPSGPPTQQRSSSHPTSSGGSGGSKGTKPAGTRSGGSSKPQTKPTAPRSTGGVPTPANPSYSFALPGPAPIGVPNFFIENFQIPPFLLPIYQAAGIEYDVPWQVLAAINEIETDYGRNLTVSSAGAVGWMQFLPSTW
jgi:hypothetical protein